MAVPGDSVMTEYSARPAKVNLSHAWLANYFPRSSPPKGTKMNQYKVIVLAIGIAFSAGAMAQRMSNTDYKAAKTKAGAEYKTDKAACASFSGNAKDICVAEAKGKEKVAKADLEAAYTPTRKTQYKARVAKAEADYAVAREKCDDKAGNLKDVCVKEAKAAETAAKADATAKMKTSDANAVAREKSADARDKASSQSADARKDAATEKLDADYSVAKEKCGAFAGGAKDECLNQAKAKFGK
jgi:hypothetical protein